MKKSEGNMEVIKAGFYGTIQDLGRFGYAHWGIPAAGAMDEQSYLLANHLLQNDPSDACLELTMVGGEFRFHHPATIIITGAPVKVQVNDQEYSINHVINVGAGDKLRLSPVKKGCRIYLGVQGGFQTEKILGSKSWYNGITKNARLEKGMTLPYLPSPKAHSASHAKVAVDDALFEEETLAVYPGAEAAEMDEGLFEQLLARDFHLSAKQNRMGIQLEEKFENNLKEILTAPVYPGTVQLTPGGKLVVLMKDAQVTGGYPRILQLSQQAISCLSQKKQGDKIRFKLIDKW
ncbi:biotin-dependent carboxyltransferase family protein [Echinicola vietnamensis]|uniref:Allophanate hydrolase subunit 2 n=1 Tax=Echinicola vietnamensis (strain DSM 17526 / LMG 23754 / KMM 6221) TaxID=926556 RepID=L0G2M0_ECHVK|nr:biotin-dependent carboxyltransferase family protein [Echinicola vietnamensis]AGA79246.1 allophanate hydrolase subunit 2 [Echinicola vietnamensis DSM 17526]